MIATGRLTKNKRICILLGAGASMPAGIPNVVQFVNAFHEDLLLRKGKKDDLVQYLEALKASWKTVSQDDPSFPADLGLERLYELLTHLNSEQEARVTIPVRLHSQFPEPSRASELLAWELKKYIQKRCLSFDRRKLKYLRPLLDFIEPESGLDILTLNYDTTMENVFQAGGIPWSDGFPEDESSIEFFSPNQFLRRTRAGSVRLLKLHGSVSWYLGPKGVGRILVRSQRSAGLRLGQARSMTHEAMMIYPTLNKALTNGPFPALTLAAQAILRNSELLLAVGYGFGDLHIRQLVIDALAHNANLRLVLVNPWPEESAELLFREARRDQDLTRRIGICGTKRTKEGALKFGFIDQALKGQWLLKHARKWLQGHALDDPVAAVQASLRRKGWKWRVRHALIGGAAYFALSQNKKKINLWTLTGKPRNLLKIDLDSGDEVIIPVKFASPRGLAWDSATHHLYIVDNAYFARRRFLGRMALAGKTGLGRIWALDSQGRVVRALTKVNHAVALPRLMRGRKTDRGLAEVLGHGTGILVWPNSLLLERPGESLLATEARGLARLDLLTGSFSYPVEIPLCFNLCGLARGPDKTVLLVDAGVHPTGKGRLMSADLETGSVQVLVTGETRFNSVLWLERSRLILVSVGWKWPRGRVLAFRITSGEARLAGSWEGLDRPGSLIEAEEAETVLAATAQGVVELTIGDKGA